MDVCSIWEAEEGDVMRAALMAKTNLDRDTIHLIVVQYAGRMIGMVVRSPAGEQPPFMTARDFRRTWQHKLFDYPLRFWKQDCLLPSGGCTSFHVVPPFSRLARGYDDHTKIKAGFPESIIRIYYFMADEDDKGVWKLLVQLADECGRLLYAYYYASRNCSGFHCCGRMTMYVANSLQDLVQFAMSEDDRNSYEAFRCNIPQPRLVVKQPYRSPLDRPLSASRPRPRPHKRFRQRSPTDHN